LSRLAFIAIWFAMPGREIQFSPMRTLPRLLSLLLPLICLASLHAENLPAAPVADFTRTEDVVYGRKFGVALTLDVIQPAKPNGYGIVYMVSGGWRSSHDSINPKTYAPYLERGYTVFAVCHGCQPRFTIPEIREDVERAVRFIRFNAAKWSVKPDALGVTGGEQQAREAAPVVAGEVGPLDPEHVEQRD